MKGSLIMPNADFVAVGKPQSKGGVWVAPMSAAVPTDVDSELPIDYVELGHCNEDGLNNTTETDNEERRAWSGEVVLTTRTSRSESYAFTLIETTEAVLKEVYGEDNVSTEADGTLKIRHNNRELPYRRFVFEILLGIDDEGNEWKKRIVVPRAKITEVGEIVHLLGEEIGYPITLGAFPDKESDGDTVIEYIGVRGEGE